MSPLATRRVVSDARMSFRADRKRRHGFFARLALSIVTLGAY